ncbi:condensation domain-containing protein [Paracoccus xiamenensis]|uniref:condensation domain-containing protein n=1 Tax=Paracoccus xiamenensis TaxID=2714901 RepID=UPI00140CEEE0|nr:condensation domain-containing protein [Paracoccus xiamenensis]NHF73298.1 condensation protein [Paracoccus xiamenensis]
MREEQVDWHPLTAGQMDFWEEFVFHPDQPVSTVAHCLELQGQLDEGALIAALDQTVAEADTLALRFEEAADGSVRQCVDPARIPLLACHDLRSAADPWAEARRIMRADIDAVLDLRRQPLAAQMLLRLGDDRWLWYFRGHHMILDGFGMSLIEGRVARLYAAAIGGDDPGAPFGRLSAFLAEDAEYHAGAACAKDRAYWQEQLFPLRADLPVLRKGAEDYGIPPMRAAFIPGAEFEGNLQAAAALLRLNWADTLTLLSAAWLALHDPDRAASQTPLPIWLPYMSRMGSVSANIPAMVVNILPLIVTPQPDEPLEALLARLAKDLRRHRRHGRYRIEEMARDCGLGAGHRFHFTPLINVMPFASPRFPGLVATRHVLAAGPGDGFNISFLADGMGGGISAAIEADPATQSRDSFPARATGFEAWMRQTVRALAADHPTDLEGAA